MFNFPVMSSSANLTSVEAVFASSSTSTVIFGAAGAGSLTPIEAPSEIPQAPSEIPLPPAIYLFGSVLGGAFWVGRKKRSAVSSLGST
jgi:hypothetical protein